MNINDLRGWMRAAAWAALLLAPAGVAGAQTATVPQTFYVDPNYFFAQEGTALKPFRTIAGALSLVVGGRGDTVVVRPGSYDERLVIPPDTTLRGEAGAGETSIIGDALVSENLVALTEGALLEGFTVGSTAGNGVLVGNGMSAEVRNCAFYASTRGIAVDTGGTLRCYNNTFYGNEVSLSVEASGNLADVRNNIFAEDAVGIFIAAGGALNSGYNCFFGDGPPVGGGSPGETDFRANPLFVDAASQNFHLRAASVLKDQGDPAATFNDLDGSPNDIGADGGPTGQRDLLAPYVAVEEARPVKGEDEVFVFQFDASTSFDYWGIAEISWDFDASNGLAFDDAFGPTAIMQYTAPGRYVVGVRVTDENGWAMEKLLIADTGASLAAAIYSTKRAGGPPLRTDLGAMTSGNIADVLWDVDLDGVVDVHRFTTTYIVSEDALPGTHYVGLEVQKAASASVSQAFLPLTLTDAPVVAAQPIAIGVEAALSVDTGGPLGGARIDFQRLSVSTEIVAAIAQPAEDDLAALPEGNLVGLAEFGPSDRPMARRSLLSIPLGVQPAADATISVLRWDRALLAWKAQGVNALRLTTDAVPRAVFEVSQLGTFAVVADKLADNGGLPPINCNNGGKAVAANAGGDFGVLGLLVLSLLGFGLARRVRTS